MGSCYIHLLVAFYFVTLATAGIMGDACDWTESGLTTGTSRGVTPVYLRCRAGRLTWLYPQGALRVILRLHNSEKDFKVCIKILSPTGIDPKDDDEIDLFAERHRQVLDFREQALMNNEISGKHKKKDIEFPARLYLEGKRGPVPLYASDDGGGKSVRCFRSKGGRAAIYVEASWNDGHSGPRRAARLLYDLQPLPTRAYDPAEEECRPCTAKEMAHAFCTSDLVAKGTIVGVQQRPELDTTELTIQVTKLIRYTSNDGRTFQADAMFEGSESTSPRPRNVTYLQSPDEDIFDELSDPDGGPWFAKIHAGAHCGVSGGAGEFLVSARRRLGALSLACSPRASEWAQVAKELNADGSAHCLLSP